MGSITPQITRADVWRARSAPLAFPTHLLKGARTAASFFSAAFHGRNDVIYLDEAGLSDIVLVDLLEDNLTTMKTIFPTVTEAYADDAFVVVRKMVADGRKFDVVVSDPFTQLTREVFFEHFDVFAAITRRVWVTGLTPDDFTSAGIPETVEGVQSWLDAKPERQEFEAVWLKVRNSGTRVCWVAVRRRTSFLGRLLGH